MSKSITVKGTEIKIIEVQKMDYISLTDMVRSFGDDTLIYSWMRNRNTLEFIGIWEQLNNPEFKGNEFVTFKMQAGLNSFNLTPRKWINATAAKGIMSRAGRYGGGTFAHKDIAFIIYTLMPLRRILYRENLLESRFLMYMLMRQIFLIWHYLD